ncbi:hypothetical protein DMH25_47030 [Streptomyces sp. WAC 01325]|nr:hypothetical protein DMH25_47030 [Streptomyces sp. WAC 01325]
MVRQSFTFWSDYSGAPSSTATSKLPVNARRLEIKSPWRKLGCSKQLLLVLAHVRKNEMSAQDGAGFGVSEATAWRYGDETLEVLAAWAPGLGEGNFVGSRLITTDQVRADELYYSQALEARHERAGRRCPGRHSVQPQPIPHSPDLRLLIRMKVAP